MLKTVIAEKLLEARAVVAFYPVKAEGDDILVWEDEDTFRNGEQHKYNHLLIYVILISITSFQNMLIS